MISHKFKCIFIHIPKTAGTSIESLINDDFSFGTSHELLSEYKNHDCFDDYYKFTFVRNTFDRIYSIFNYYSLGGNHDHPKNIKQWVVYWYKKLTVHQYYTDIDISRNIPVDFTKFCIKYLRNRESFFGRDILTSQYQYLLVDNDMKIDFIGRFENLDSDFQKVKNKLNINQELPHHRLSANKDHYSLYYDDVSVQIVSDYYDDEIKYFNFSFEKL